MLYFVCKQKGKHETASVKCEGSKKILLADSENQGFAATRGLESKKDPRDI